MKNVFLSFILLFGSGMLAKAQVTVKLRYPKCELVSPDEATQSKNVQTLVISSQEEFDKHFRITDGSTIDFSANIVLAAFVGSDKADKFIEINAAQFIPQGRSLNVRYDINNEVQGSCGKYCVVVIHKPDYKHINFLKGKLYKMSTQWGD